MRKAALALAMLLAASMWIYFGAILVPFQKREATAHDHPRGNLSDLYPRWLGARELLLHGRDPYSPEVTREIQQGYYGRVLDSSRPGDPKDQAAFAYPVYVVFLIAPTVRMSFVHVALIFANVLWIVTAISVLLWLRVLHWKPAIAEKITIVVLTLGSIYVIEGIKLQQLSLVVAFLLAACLATAAGGYLSLAGGLLAMATIKPQIALLPAVWLLTWGLARWRARWRLFAAFCFVMLAQLAGAEVVLRGWLSRFIVAIQNYHSYTNNQSLLQILSSPGVGYAIAVLLVFFTAWLLRESLGVSSGSVEFGVCAALVLTLVVLTVPMFALYNQVLLLPGLLLIARDWRHLQQERTGRLLSGMIAILVVWPWLATLALDAGLLVFPTNAVLDRWRMPFFTTFALPPLLFATLAYHLIRNLRPAAIPATAG